MIIYTDNDKEEVKIYHKDLQRLAKHIDGFVDVYFKNIFIENREHIENLNKLKKISALIKMGRYDELINDTSIISYAEPEEDDDYINYPF